MQELDICYQAFAQNILPQLPMLPIQYADYAQWQRQWLQTGIEDIQLEYWKNKLASAPRLLKLPIDYQRPAVESHKGRFYPFFIDRNKSQKFSCLMQSLRCFIIYGIISTI